MLLDAKTIPGSRDRVSRIAVLIPLESSGVVAVESVGGVALESAGGPALESAGGIAVESVGTAEESLGIAAVESAGSKAWVDGPVPSALPHAEAITSRRPARSWYATAIRNVDVRARIMFVGSPLHGSIGPQPSHHERATVGRRPYGSGPTELVGRRRGSEVSKVAETYHVSWVIRAGYGHGREGMSTRVVPSRFLGSRWIIYPRGVHLSR